MEFFADDIDPRHEITDRIRETTIEITADVRRV